MLSRAWSSLPFTMNGSSLSVSPEVGSGVAGVVWAFVATAANVSKTEKEMKRLKNDMIELG